MRKVEEFFFEKMKRISKGSNRTLNRKFIILLFNALEKRWFEELSNVFKEIVLTSSDHDSLSFLREKKNLESFSYNFIRRCFAVILHQSQNC